MKSSPDPVYMVKGNMTEVHCLLYDLTPDNELLFAGTQSGVIHIWDLQLNKEYGTLQCGNETCLMMHKFGNLLITQDKECNVKVWDSVNRNFVYKHQLADHKHVTFCKMETCIYNDEQALLIPNANGEVLLYSVANCKLLHSLKMSTFKEQKLGEIMIIKAIKLDKCLHVLVVYENGMLLLWDVRNWEVISDAKFSCDEFPIALDFNDDRGIGICGSNSNTLYIFTVAEQNRQIMKSGIIELKNPGCNSVKIRQDGKLFAVGCWDGKIRIYSFKTYKLLAVLEHHEGSVLYILFSHIPVSSWNCDYLLAAGAVDKRVSFWNIYN